MSKHRDNQHRPRSGGSGSGSGPTNPTPPTGTGETVNVEARVVPEGEAAASTDNVTPLFKTEKQAGEVNDDKLDQIVNEAIAKMTADKINKIKRAEERAAEVRATSAKLKAETKAAPSKRWYQNDAVKITATTLGFGLAIGFLVTLASGAGTAVNRKMNG